MTEMNPDPFTENIPAYALGTLNVEEAAALRAHLPTCAVCQAELARYQTISDGLMAALPPRMPPARIRRQLEQQLNRDKISARPRVQWTFRQIALGLLIFALAATNLLAFMQIRDLRQQHQQLVTEVEKQHTILGMLAASTEIHPVNGDGFSGNFLLDREKNLAYLLTWNLPPPPEGQVYQVWLIDPNGEETPAALFRPADDRPFTSAALSTSRTFMEFVGIRVTLEPAGGSEKPTGEPVFDLTY